MNDIKKLSERVSDVLPKIKRYLPLLFAALLLIIYGSLVDRVQVLNSQEPALTDVQTQSKTAKVPNIDPTVLRQIKNLQDNSVSVQSIFDQARSNPFQESQTTH